MFSFRYPATVTRDQANRVLVRFPDLKGATDGSNLTEALVEAADLLGSELAYRMAARESIPAPSPPRRGQRLIAVPLYLAPKLALYLEMRKQGMTSAELARRLHVGETVVRRMLDPYRDTKPERIQSALEVLGKNLVVAVESAA